MRNTIDSFHDKVATIWVGQVRFPGKITLDFDPNLVLVTDLQAANVAHLVRIDAITAITIDEKIDTEEKYHAAIKAQEEKNKAAADEYRRMAEELAKVEKK